MDDFRCFILGWDLKLDMSGSSGDDLVQQAIDFTSMTDVLVESRTVLLLDNGARPYLPDFNLNMLCDIISEENV